MKTNSIRITSALLLCMGAGMFTLMAQPSKGRPQEIPSVFVIGEYEQEYETLLNDYPRTLLDVCGNDMSQAFDLWIGLVEEMEAYAKLSSFDLTGVKAWFHVFFEKDGTITSIGFHLKPTSRNVDTLELTAFLAEFIAQYKFPFTSMEKFANYTSVSFPSVYAKPQTGGR
ncbi:MAG: hypothetical protein WA004_20495 [Saprospiraceae bacterium]